MIFKLTLKSEKYPETGEDMEMELSEEQVMWIERHVLDGVSVPLYATTMAKRKYGDCKIGDIINISKI